VLAGLAFGGYRHRASALAAVESGPATQAEATDESPQTGGAPKNPVSRVIDEAGFIDDYNTRKMESYLQSIYDESGVDIRFIFAQTVPGDLESFARRRARELGLGRDADKRGLLFVYDFSSPQRMRIEVGPGMQGIFPDGFVGYLMREQATAFFAAGDRLVGLKMTLRVVLHRLREASLGRSYDPRAVTYIRDSVRLATGGGATTRARVGRELWAEQFREAPADVRARFGPQPTVAAAHARYLEAMRDGRFQPDLPLYTPGTHTVLRRFPMTAPFRDLILFSEYGHAYTIVERGDLAILYFTTTPLVSAHLFRRTPAGWQLDLDAEVRDTRELVGSVYTWSMVQSGDDYTTVFADLFTDCGAMGGSIGGTKRRLLRPARGDNRRLPVRGGGWTPACANNTMATESTREASLLLPVVGTRTEEFGYPTQTIDRLAVRRLLQTRAYDRLDAVLEAYADSALRDHRLEYRLFDAYAAFDVPVPSMEPLLTEWVRQRPASAAALLARATFLKASGWKARGGNRAAKTSRQQFEGMREFFRRAEADLAAALRLAPNSIVAYRSLINIVSTSRGDPAKSRQILDRALRLQPNSFVLRTAHMYNLLPRWGGSYDAMTEFAEESAPYASRNPLIRTLKGFVDWDRGRVLESAGKKDQAAEAYGRALRFGNFWQFRYERGELYSRADQHEKAIEDLNSVLTQNPQHADALYWRSLAEYDLGRRSPSDANVEYLSQSFRDIKLAVALDPTDEYYQKRLAFIRESIPGFEQQ
jgi:tetratricopeptide (TPR) repeat protein